MKVRLDRLLSDLGYCSSKEAQKLFRSGVICDSSGRRYSSPTELVDPNNVRWTGSALDPTELVLLVNKPAGHSCDPEASPPHIQELLPGRYSKRRSRPVCVDPLYVEATGIVLLTDNSQLQRQVTLNWKAERVYEVTTLREVTKSQIARISEVGWCLPGDSIPVTAARCRQTSSHSLELALTSERPMQVLRMFQALGNPITKLHRSWLGVWGAKELRLGKWRHLNEAERSGLKRSCGLLAERSAL